MKVDHVSGNERQEEDWEDADEVRRGSTCYKCGVMGTFARHLEGKARKGQAKTEARVRQRLGQDDERCREERLRQIKRTQGRTRGRVEKPGIPRTVLDVRWNRTQSRQSVDGDSLASERRYPTAEVEDNLSQRRIEKLEGCGWLGMARGARGADPSTGHMKINAINHVKLVKDGATGSEKFANWVRPSSHRQTCKLLEKTDGTTEMDRRNKFDVLNLTESRQELEKVNAVDMVQEIVEITVDSGAAKSVWLIRERGVLGTKATKTVRLAVASGSPIRVEGDARTRRVSLDKVRGRS